MIYFIFPNCGRFYIFIAVIRFTKRVTTSTLNYLLSTCSYTILW